MDTLLQKCKLLLAFLGLEVEVVLAMGGIGDKLFELCIFGDKLVDSTLAFCFSIGKIGFGLGERGFLLFNFFFGGFESPGQMLDL